MKKYSENLQIYEIYYSKVWILVYLFLFLSQVILWGALSIASVTLEGSELNGVTIFSFLAFSVFSIKFYDSIKKLQFKQPAVILDREGILLHEYSEAKIKWGDVEKIIYPSVTVWGQPEIEIKIKDKSKYSRDGKTRSLLQIRGIGIHCASLESNPESVRNLIEKYRSENHEEL